VSVSRPLIAISTYGAGATYFDEIEAACCEAPCGRRPERALGLDIDAVEVEAVLVDDAVHAAVACGRRLRRSSTGRRWTSNTAAPRPWQDRRPQSRSSNGAGAHQTEPLPDLQAVAG